MKPKTTSRRRFLQSAGAAAAGLAMPRFLSAASNKQRPPNIVFFLVDDLGWSDVGCYGNRFHETPNIDRLASQGMRFTDAYAACPVCSPTRASIMTGKYPARLDLTDFIPGHWRPYEKLRVPDNILQLPHEEVTIAEALNPADYVTASLGKWHLGGRNWFPPSQGFDESIVTGGRHFAPHFRTTPKMDLPEGTYQADFLTDQAERFIRQNKDKPFMLYLSHFAVHIPLQAKKKTIEKYEAKPKPPTGVNNPTYAAMVEHVDDSLGRVMKVLDKLGLTDETILVFFSDNGGLRQHFKKIGPIVTSNAPLRDEKGTLYEGGIREPLIVRWPGKVQPGSVCDSPVTSVDFLPTFTDIVGRPTPPNVDGESLRPLLTETGTLQRDAIYWHYPHYHHSTPAGAIRRGDLKLIEFYEDGKLELYNLREDIGEQHNLADTMPDKARDLQKQLAAWRKRVDAKMPTPNPNHDPERAHEWGDPRERIKLREKKG